MVTTARRAGALLAAVALMFSGCGGSSKPAAPSAPQDVVKEFLTEIAAKHHKAACALLSPAGREDAAGRFIQDYALFSDNNKQAQPTCVGWLKQVNAEGVAADTLKDFGYTHTDYEQNHAVVRAKHGDWVLEKVVGKWRIQTVETLAQA